MSAAYVPQELPAGLIFDIARSAGIEIPERCAKFPLRCPFHKDRQASAVLFESNRFFCPACDLRLGAKQFAEMLAVPWPLGGTKNSTRATDRPAGRPRQQQIAFTAADAQEVWALAYQRARSDPPFSTDAAVYAYLARRELASAWDEGAYGILTEGMPLHPSVASFPRTGHRLLCPLFDHHGHVACVQARAIVHAQKKVLFPTGSTATRTVFANAAGQSLLRGTYSGDTRVFLVEGLTDFLAMCVVTSLPILSAPGAGFLVGSVGPWARGRTVFVAPDHDDAGDRVLPRVADAAYRFGAATVRRIDWPVGCKDAADALVKVGPQDIFDAIECPRTERRQ